MGAPWTDRAALPGGDFQGGLGALVGQLLRDFPFVPEQHMKRIARRHGTRARQWLDGAGSLADMGEHFGADLYAREVDYMVAKEWVRTADDVLYRRSKAGVMMNTLERARVQQYLESGTR